ncbi:MAG: hypothetical protein MZV70_42380 [Desulfobacterales bacterium]|nr:hypothetical protein [Desulfobacterales bacterium]
MRGSCTRRWSRSEGVDYRTIQKKNVQSLLEDRLPRQVNMLLHAAGTLGGIHGIQPLPGGRDRARHGPQDRQPGHRPGGGGRRHRLCQGLRPVTGRALRRA